MNAEFQVHRLNSQGLAKAEELAEKFDGLLTYVDGLNSVKGRYNAIVRTKLEEACFFAKKLIACAPENQQ